MLHAASVRIDRSVSVFVGASGVGKTTLVQLLEARGLDALADDLIPVRVDDDSVWVPVDNSASDSDGVEDSRQLRRLFFLRRAEGESLQIREIPGRREVFAALTRHGYGNLPVAGLWTFQALVFERLARSTRAFELGLPEGIGPLRTAVSELLEHGSLVGR